MWGEFRVDDEGVKESTGGEVPPPAVRHKLHHQPFFPYSLSIVYNGRGEYPEVLAGRTERRRRRRRGRGQV